MSRVIKSAIWQEEPRIVEVPQRKKAALSAALEEDGLPGAIDEKTHARLMSEIVDKQRQADEMLKEAKVSCSILRQKAQQEHDELIEGAQQELSVLREDAKKKGHEEGFAAGREEGMKKAEEECRQAILDANAKAEKTLADARNETESYVDQAENEIAEIAMHIVEKILPQHFIDVPQVVLPLVREAILKVKDQSEVVVHVAPDAYDLVLLARNEFQSMLAGNAKLEVHSDESLGAGDCIVETPNGSVDARLATQLELVKQAVQEVMS